jgi:hydroxyacylglutathione hydrolase
MIFSTGRQIFVHHAFCQRHPLLGSPAVPTISALPAFSDNYIWVVHDRRQALVVDPGDPATVLQFLKDNQLELSGILVTHHHHDHVGGLAQLAPICQGPVVGPLLEQAKIEHLSKTVEHGDGIQIMGLKWDVLGTPGHTEGHVAFFCQTSSLGPILFCGDTLFSAGCGRLFEGTPSDMHTSLQRLSSLPDETLVCCAHEYTLANLRFAQAVEPHNQDIERHRTHCEQQRVRNLPTLPSSIKMEKKINPFLRTSTPAVRSAALTFAQQPLPHDADVLGSLREWKNNF